MIRKILALSLLCCFIVSIGHAQSRNEKSRTLFSVGKKEVSIDEFLYLYRKNHSAEKPEEYTEEKIDEYLDLYVRFKLKVEAARDRKLDTTAAFIKEFNTYREELRKPYMPDNRLIDSLVELTYNRLKEEVKVSHLLINLKPDASPADTLKAYNRINELRNRVVNGENFSVLASQYSEDPSARVNKGNLGYFTALQMVFPFENAAYSTGVGKVSNPVRTSFGYHILYVEDRRPSSGEVEVSHIMLRTGENHDNENARNTAFDIYDRLQKGVKWEELCKEFSEDAASKDNGGRLRPFGVGGIPGVPEFEQIAFNLKNPGDISDPFQTQFGWHLVRLERKIPLPPFEELAASLKNRVSRDARAQLSKDAIHAKMRKEFNFAENSAVREKLFALSDSTLTNGNWNPALSSPKEVLFSMKGRDYLTADFVSYVKRTQQRSSLSPEKHLAQLYEKYVEEIQGLLFEEKIKAENPDYAWLLNEYYEGILLFEIMEEEVWNKASEDSVGQRAFYEKNADKYQAQDRLMATVYSTRSKDDITALKTLIGKAEADSVQQFVKSRKVRKEIGLYEKDDRPYLADIKWGRGVHLSENNGFYYLVSAEEVLPPGRKSFEEARASVISDYQNELENRWISQLRKKFPVKVNKKAKQSLEKQLIKNKA